MLSLDYKLEPNKSFNQYLSDELLTDFGIVDTKIISFIKASFFRDRKHNYYKGYFCYHYDELNRLFGRSNFVAINDSIGLFDVMPYNMHDRYTRGFKHTDELIECFNRAIDKWQPLIDVAEYESFSKAGGVASRDCNNNNSKFTSNILKAVRVDVDGLNNLKNIIPVSKEENLVNHKRQNLIKAQSAIMLEVALDKNKLPKCWVAQSYTQHKTGRVYSTGISLQNCCTEVRNGALRGLYSFDISNCHWNILRQTTKVPLPIIEFYIKNKKEVRSTLVSELGLPGDDEQQLKGVKVILLSLIYGASLCKFDIKNAIAGICESEECYNRVQSNPLISGIYKEVKRAARELIKVNTIKLGRHSGKLINIMGLVCDEVKSSKKLSHILQGYEAKALEVAVGVSRVDTAVLIHDGWVTYSEYKPEVFERAIYDQLGFKLEVEINSIECSFGFKVNSARALNIKGLCRVDDVVVCKLIEPYGFPMPLSISNLNNYINTKLIEQYPNLSHKHRTISQTTNFAQNKIRLKYLDS